MPPGQLDHLHAALGCPPGRAVDLDLRLVRQAGEFKKRPSDPARQRYALVQVPLRLLELGSPDLGTAQVDQRQRAQLLTQAGLCRLGGLSQRLQPLCLLGDSRQVPALPGVQQPDHAEQNLKLPLPASRH